MDSKIQIQHWPTRKLIPYDRNPRINDHAVDQVAAAIKEFGFRIPVLIKSNGDLIDGHLRLKAALKINLETVPVVICDDLSEAQIKAFRISINRMADLAEWDMDLLLLEMEELEFTGYDLDLTGFDAANRPKAEETPELEDNWQYTPRTLFDARKGEWQKRKNSWIAQGIDSEKGRGGI